MPNESTDQSQAERAEGVGRMLNDEDPPVDPPPNEVEPPETAKGADNVGQSSTRRGENIVKDEGKEPGRIDTGPDGTPAGRPTGTSTPRDQTSIDPG